MTKKQEEGLSGPDRRRMSRQDFLKRSGTGLAGAALLGVAGCFHEPVEFDFSFGTDPLVQDLVNRFNKKFEGQYKANYREMFGDSSEYFEQLNSELQACGGDLTLIGGDVTWAAELAANGYIIDLSDRFRESEREAFLPGPIESNIYNNAIYGVPWFTDVGLLYYRQDLLRDSGISEPPATWADLKGMAEQVAGESNTRFGFVFQGGRYEGGVVNALEYIKSHGGSVLAEDDRVVINSDESIAGLEMERSMVEDGIAPQRVARYTEEESQTDFLNGEAVFIRHWPSMYKEAYSPESNIVPEQIGVAQLPAGEGGQSAPGLGGWNFYINAGSGEERQNAAYEFVKFATAPEQQKFRALEGSFLPTLKSLYDDPEIQAKVLVIAQAGEAPERAEPRPVSPYYSDMSLAMDRNFWISLRGEVYKEEVSSEEAVERLQIQLQAIVNQEFTY